MLDGLEIYLNYFFLFFLTEKKNVVLNLAN